MTSELTFIHAADIHLGAPMRGLRDVNPEWAARIEKSIPDAYGRVIDAAIERSVDFVILAGDAFDTSRVSYDEYLHFFEGLQRLDEAGVHSYLITGNHDPFTTWAKHVSRLPDTAHMLGANGPQFALHRRAGEPLCIIAGRGYYNQAWPAGQDIQSGLTRLDAQRALEEAGEADAKRAPFTIGVIHTGLDVDVSKAPANERELLSSDIDYWACGHLHRRYVRPNDANPRIVFPGCVQGRDIKETGERGCYLVKLADHEPVHLEFVPTASIVFESPQVNVGACQTLADVARLVQAELFRVNGQVRCDDMIVRVTLTGATALHAFLAQPAIIADLRKHINNAYPSFFCDALIDQTKPLCDKAVQEREALFPSIVADIADEQRGREDVLINYVQNEFVKRGIAVPSALSRRVHDFVDAAEVLVFDLLREEAE